RPAEPPRVLRRTCLARPGFAPMGLDRSASPKSLVRPLLCRSPPPPGTGLRLPPTCLAREGFGREWRAYPFGSVSPCHLSFPSSRGLYERNPPLHQACVLSTKPYPTPCR